MWCLYNGILSVDISETGAKIRCLLKDKKVFIFPQQVVGKSEGRDIVRGGMHPCSPIFGKKSGQFADIPQHGGLRHIDWQVDEVTETEAKYSCEFRQFNYWLTYKVHYRLAKNCLRVITRVENKQADPVPFEFGWHPYFFAPGGAKIFFDFYSKAELISISQPYDPQIFRATGIIRIELAGVGKVWMRLRQRIASGRLCIWTDWQRNYVCVEPLLSHPGAFNTSRGVFLGQEPVISNLEMTFE